MLLCVREGRPQSRIFEICQILLPPLELECAGRACAAGERGPEVGYDLGTRRSRPVGPTMEDLIIPSNLGLFIPCYPTNEP